MGDTFSAPNATLMRYPESGHPGHPQFATLQPYLESGRPWLAQFAGHQQPLQPHLQTLGGGSQVNIDMQFVTTFIKTKV